MTSFTKQACLRLSLIMALVALPACGGNKCGSTKGCSTNNCDITEQLVVENVVVNEECAACNHDDEAVSFSRPGAERISGVETALNLK